VIQIVHVRKKPFDIYIGRQFAEFPESKWHNPFRVHDLTQSERERVCEKYREYVKSSPVLMAALPELDGKILGCWCRPKAPCHGDILVELFNEMHNKV
jgi:hypothetical protein